MSEEKETFFVFSIAEKKYAVRSSFMLEISDMREVSPLPFGPPVIEGVLNYDGSAVTILSFDFFNSKSVLGSRIIIFNDEEELFGIRISEIDKFCEVEEENIIPENSIDYFMGFIKIGQDEIPVLNPNFLKSEMRKSLGYK